MKLSMTKVLVSSMAVALLGTGFLYAQAQGDDAEKKSDSSKTWSNAGGEVSTDAPAVVEQGTDDASQEPAPAEGKDGKDAPPPKRKPKGTFLQEYGFMLVLGLGVILMFVLSSRSRKKREKKFSNMLSDLKKGDRVVTIGGIVGNAVDVRDDEVVIRIDDNCKMKVIRRAIARVGADAKTEANQDQQGKG